MLGAVLASLRDLQWRRRRFAVAAVGTALVFALTLLLGSLVGSLNGEVDRTLEGLGADRFVFPATATSPFYGLAPFDQDVATTVAGSTRGRAAPVMMVRQAVDLGHEDVTDLFLVAGVPGGPGQPPVVEGRAPSGPGEIALDRSAGVAIGATVTLAGRPYEVVGRTVRRTLSAGNPTGYLLLSDVQAAVLGGARLSSMVLVDGGDPDAPLPAGFRSFTRDEARADLLRPSANALGSLVVLQALLWLVAAAIVGTVLYLSAVERTREFAVLKATGSTSAHIAAGLALQAVVVAVVASATAVVLARLLTPVFPLDVQLLGGQIALTPAVAVLVGLLGSSVGMRHAVSVDPALAFGSGR
ncbi:MAG TPA: ABC transporter permease [Acidimicrobiales bacterium]|nr:ABC transporter permease [Acidimicrobiales bacterium]